MMSNNSKSSVFVLLGLFIARPYCTAFQSPSLFQQRVAIRLNAQSERDLSASGSERRAEDKRRNDRKSDVVIGKTSAVQGEKDFMLDPKATETSLMASSTGVEQEIFQQTERGLDMLRAVSRLPIGNTNRVTDFKDTVLNLK